MRRARIALGLVVALTSAVLAASGFAAPPEKPAPAASASATPSPIASAAPKPATSAAPTPAAMAEGYKHLAAGQKLLALKKFSEARAELEASFDLDPQPIALKGIGEALRGEGRLVEAYDTFQRALVQPGRPLMPYQRKDAELAIAELAKKTAAITVEVNEPDAAIAVDGTAYGVSPRPNPIRLEVGAHKITITKAGFAPFEAAVTLAAGDATQVSATLTALAPPVDIAIVTIHEKTGRALEVVIDGLVVGTTPFKGSFGKGTYHVALTASGVSTAPRELTVVAGDITDLELDAPQPPPLVVAEPPCSTDADCGATSRCEAGLCRKQAVASKLPAQDEPCTSSGACAAGLVCTDAVCHAPDEQPFALRRALSASWRVGFGLGGETSWVAPVHMLAATFEVPLGRWVRYHLTAGLASINGAKAVHLAPLGFGVPIPIALASLEARGIKVYVEPGIDALRVYSTFGADVKDTVLTLGLWGRLVATRGALFAALVPIDLESAFRHTTSNGTTSFSFGTSGWNYTVSLGVGVQL